MLPWESSDACVWKRQVLLLLYTYIDDILTALFSIVGQIALIFGFFLDLC